MKMAFALLAMVSVAAFAQENGSFTDARDKRAYKTVKIGGQVWMAENLDYAGEDGNLGACYGKKPENCKKYGSLYTWEDAMKACPAGWYLPTKEEWDVLTDFVGGEAKAGTQLKAKDGWNAYDFSRNSPNAPKCKWTEETKEEINNRGEIVKPAGVAEHDACHTDKYGFAALPGGSGISGGFFPDAGDYGIWWSASEDDAAFAYHRNMGYDYERAGWNYNVKARLYSVRCLQDRVAAFVQEKGSFTDARDKKTYETTKIGEQTWMAENLNFNAKGSKCYDNKDANCKKYGRLYDWKTAGNSCPKGWHLPKSEEWDALYRYADGTSGTESPYKSKTAGKHLKAKEGWNDYSGKSGNGTDDFGFAALPGGRVLLDGSFNNAGYTGYWWSASEGSAYDAYSRHMYYDEDADWKYNGKTFLFSVRCLQD